MQEEHEKKRPQPYGAQKKSTIKLVDDLGWGTNFSMCYSKPTSWKVGEKRIWFW
jgi:hypothetical protein